MRINVRLIKGLVVISGLNVVAYFGLWFANFSPTISAYGGLKPTLLLVSAVVCLMLGAVAGFLVRQGYPMRDYQTLMLLSLPYHVVLWGAEPRFQVIGLAFLSLGAGTVLYVTWQRASSLAA